MSTPDAVTAATSAPSEAVGSPTPVGNAPHEETKLVSEQFAFDYDKVADEVQLIGDDLFGVLAPRQLHKLRPHHRHAWCCKICGYATNWSDENSICVKCGRSRDPEWLQVPGAGSGLEGCGGPGGLLEVGALVELSASPKASATSAVVTRIDPLRKTVTFHALSSSPAAANEKQAAAAAPTQTLKAKCVPGEELAANVLQIYDAQDSRGKNFMQWFRCAECDMLTELANGAAIFLPPIDRGNMSERVSFLERQLDKDHMARKAAKNDMDNEAVLHFNEQISAHQRELNELRKQLAPPQPWCAHCGWEPQKPTSRPGYEWTGKRAGRRPGHHRS